MKIEIFEEKNGVQSVDGLFVLSRTAETFLGAVRKESNKGCGYYDVSTPQDAPIIELNVCKYLDKQGIHMSHPSMKKRILVPRLKTSSSAISLHTKPKFIEKRSRLFSSSLGGVQQRNPTPEPSSCLNGS